MAYTEVKLRNSKKYYYRVISIRNKDKISKKRLYLGADLSNKELKEKEKQADIDLKKLHNPALNKLKPKIIKILKKNGIKKASIFGSYARGDQKKNSDLDILIEPTEHMGLIDFSGLKIELEDELGKKVDLITYDYIHPLLKENILNSEVKII
jgi:predicted nucleotidyltransferase